VAATGVGAGDIITAGLGGSVLGVAILWAALWGAVLKWTLNEGIARWQMATGTTILEGWNDKLGYIVRWIFLGYLLSWTIFTGGALITACGVAGTGLLPVSQNLLVSKIFWGVLHSAIGVFLVLKGGFRLFERMMSFFIGIMFIAVIMTALLSQPDWLAIGRGLLIPRIPENGLGWVLGILGGVGGTVTLLSYGYWIMEEKRSGMEGLKISRIDLGVGYLLTAVFGIAMISIGSRVLIEGSGVSIAPVLANQLADIAGPAGKWIFLIGFWGAVFSSMLGVWQGVPYLFADVFYNRSAEHSKPTNLSSTRAYKYYLVILAVVPLPILGISVKSAQLIYSVFGSLFMPFLALTLLIMNNREKWVGRSFKNGIIINFLLIITILFFTYAAFSRIQSYF